MAIIEFKDISKQYRLGVVTTSVLKDDFYRWWVVNILRKEDPYLKIGDLNDRSVRGNSSYVWALRDINFTVERGDVLGIIGKNGSGKSTLLKLLSKVTAPTTGTIKARGRIGSLLEVGTGFHPELTGLENIYMNGAILGMTKSEIKSRLEEIVDFSGCERYIDTPVKRYSSGMKVRLGFAVAAHLEPEILVVDEVLAVGDAEFQKKAIGKMQDVSKGDGRTVLFVSHNMDSVSQLCNKGLLLDNGTVSLEGDIDTVINAYIDKKSENVDIAEIKRNNSNFGFFRFTNITYHDENGNLKYPTTGEPLMIRIYFKNEGDLKRKYRFAFTIWDVFEKPLISCSTKFYSKDIQLKNDKYYIDCLIDKLPLTEGKYMLSLYSAVDNICLDWIGASIPFEVKTGSFYPTGVKMDDKFKAKIVLCEHKWLY